MTIMNLQNQITVIHGVAGHNELLAAVSDTFKFFEDATAGSEPAHDLEAKLAETTTTVQGIRGLHETMVNEWNAYAKALTSAYGNFSHDVVRRQGFDDKAQVRNLARSIAAGAHTRIRDNARAHLVRTMEGIRD